VRRIGTRLTKSALVGGAGLAVGLAAPFAYAAAAAATATAAETPTHYAQWDIPSYQLWVAAEDQPAPRERPAVVVPVTAPRQPVDLKVCGGTATDIDVVGAPAGGAIDAHPAHCEVTYRPHPGFTGEDSFTLRIVEPDGRALIKSFDVRVARQLADTGVADLIGLVLLAAGLLAAGFVLTIGVQRAGREEP